jgi:hypothetical protein
MKILSTLTAILLAATLSFAGVKNGDCGNGHPHGNVNVKVTGGIMGDYHVTFTDDAGSSGSTTGTPTMGGDAGEVEDTGWSTTSTTNDDGTTTTGGSYRVKDGKLQKKDSNGNPVNCTPCPKKKKKTSQSDDEYIGTLP